MAITSAGYAGTINATQWAQIMELVGGRAFTVQDQDAWAVTIGEGAREIEIAPGVGSGRGVVDTSDALETKSLASVASGSRWDMIVARRNWGSKTTTFEVVPGGSTATLPEREVGPGDVDDQPIALCRVQAGEAAVQEVRDLRVWGSDGGSLAADVLALDYLDRLGSAVVIGNSRYLRALDGSGDPTWLEYPLVKIVASATEPTYEAGLLWAKLPS